MKKLILSLIFFMMLFGASSQKVYFIYIQTENEQPFFVRMNDKTYSSSASGYLILSKLRDSTYNFQIGFPQNKWPDQKFSVQMNTKDHGYLLKNFGDKGWGLFDMQTLSVQMVAKSEVKTENVIANNDVSKFTEILAKAVDDSTLKQKPAPIKSDEKKTEVLVAQPIVKKEEPKLIQDTALITRAEEKKKETLIKPEEKKLATEKNEVLDPPALKVIEKEPVKKEPLSYAKSTVKRRYEGVTMEGYGMSFTDDLGNGKIDTINITIPNQKTISGNSGTQPVEEKKFLDIKTEPVKIVKDTIVQKTESSVVSTDKNVEGKTVFKNNCPAIANETDFLELRRKMASALNDDGMLEEARKYFKMKCFYTAQIKNLAVLFLNDESKYRFFDTAYKYVSDIENYGSLQSELKEEYYINRFKAMLRN